MKAKAPIKEEMKFFYNDTVFITSDSENEFFEDKLNFYGGEFWTVVDFDRVDGKLYYTVEIDEDKSIVVPQDCLIDADDIYEDGNEWVCEDCACSTRFRDCTKDWLLICPNCWEKF